VVAKTDPNGTGSKAMSLILVETDRPGFRRGRKLDKVGQHAADTAELFFDDVRVPAENLLGAPSRRGSGLALCHLGRTRGLPIALPVRSVAMGDSNLNRAVTRPVGADTGWPLPSRAGRWRQVRTGAGAHGSLHEYIDDEAM
jgi:alkylation response protein AidB-like acyl-CoA dehydrogenase